MRTGRIIAWSLGGMAALLALAALLLAAALLWLRSGSGEDWLLSQAERAAALQGVQLRAQSLTGPFPERLELRGVTLADEAGEWMRADRLLLHWRPFALWDGLVHIAALEADALSLHRLPDLPPAPEEAETDAFALPSLALALDRLRLQDLAIGEAVLGEAAVLDVEGGAELTPDGAARAFLSARRTDGTPARLRAETLWSVDGRLSVAAEYDEPAGGLLARLADLPGLPALSLDVEGEGPLDDWLGTLAAEAHGLMGVEAALRLRDARTVLADGLVFPGEGLDTYLAALLGPRASVALEMSAMPGYGGLELGRFALQGAAGDAAVSGRIGLRDGLDLDVAFETPDGAVLAGITGVETGTLAARAHIKGPLAGPWGVGLSARAASIPLLPRPFDGPLTLTLSTETDGESLDGVTAVLDTPAGRAGLEGRVVFAPLAVSGVLTADVPDLAALEPLTGQALPGGLRASVADFRLDGDLNAAGVMALRFHGLALAGTETLIGPAPRIDARVSGRLDEGLTFDALSLRAAAFALSGRAALTQGYERLDSSWRVEVDDLAVLDPALSGRPVIEGTATGPVAAPILDAVLSLPQGRVAGHPVQALVARTRVEGLDADPHGQIDLSGESPLGPVSVATRFTLRDDARLHLSDVGAELRGTRLLGDLVLDLSDGGLDGAFTGQAPLAPWGDLAGLDDLRGAGALALKLETRAGAPWASLRFEGAGGVRALDLDAFALSAEGGVEDLSFSLDARGQGAGAPFVLALAGGYGGDAVTLARLQGTVAGESVVLDAPLRVDFTPQGGVATESVRLRLGEGLVTARMALDDEGADATLEARALPARLAAPFVTPAPESGWLDADLTFSASRGSGASARLDLALSDLRLAGTDPEEIPALSTRMEAAWDGERVSAEGEAGGWPGDPLRFSGVLGLGFDGQAMRPVLAPDAPVEARARWRGDVGALMQFAPVTVHRLTGRGRVELDLAGTLDAPRPVLFAALENGGYENLETGTLLRALNAEARSDGFGPITFEAEATDGGRGRVEALGHADLAQGRDGVVLTVTARDAVLVRRDEVVVRTHADIALEDGLLSGRVETESVEIRLVEGPAGGGITTLAVEEIGRETAPAPTPQDVAADPVRLDLLIDMPRRVFVRGRGLDSEWAGRFAVTGTTDDPVIDGAVRHLRGDLVLADKRFAFERGVVTIDPQRGEPLLDIVAVHDTGTLLARIIVSGPVSQPDLRLDSVPALPQEEILSQVLFGKGASQLQPQEALRLVEAAAVLSGMAPAGPGILDRVRGTLGVDVLQVDPTFGEGGVGASVTVGRYLREGVYVGGRTGSTPDSGRVMVEIELTPNITVETEAGQDATGRVGLNWKWDY